MWILLLLLLSTPAFAAQVDVDPVAEVAADFKEDPKARPAGETVLPSFPIEKWEQPKIAMDVTQADLKANPDLLVTVVFEVAKDGITFTPLASVTSRGGVVEPPKGRLPSPPGFRLSRKGVVPDGWVGRIRVVTNKPLTYGAEAGPDKK